MHQTGGVTFTYNAYAETPYVMRVAALLSRQRLAESIGVTDYVAGIYVISLERVQRFWPTWEAFEAFTHEHCGLALPRWWYWSALQRREVQGRLKQIVRGRVADYISFNVSKRISGPLYAIQKTALACAAKRPDAPVDVSWSRYTSIDFLASVFDHDVELASKMIHFGLDASALRKAVEPSQ